MYTFSHEIYFCNNITWKYIIMYITFLFHSLKVHLLDQMEAKGKTNLPK